VDRLSVQRFKKADKDVAVQYFLVRKVGSTEAAEKRTLRWEDEQAAVRLLTFAEARVHCLKRRDRATFGKMKTAEVAIEHVLTGVLALCASYCRFCQG